MEQYPGSQTKGAERVLKITRVDLLSLYKLPRDRIKGIVCDGSHVKEAHMRITVLCSVEEEILCLNDTTYMQT